MTIKPVCVGVTNLIEAILPSSGTSAASILQDTIDAVETQRRSTGQPMIAHVNHPNYGWALTAEDIAGLRGSRFLEVFNGHPVVRNAGDDLHPSTERLWDMVLTERLARGDSPFFGTAVDDAHQYGVFDSSVANPGRGWVMVRSLELSADAILAAMEAGDFYASTGVVLEDVQVDAGRLNLSIRAEAGVSYATRFIGTRRADAGPGDPSAVGTVLAEVAGEAPAYAFRGDELYVRATVLSSKPKPIAPLGGEVEMAWTQPVVPNH